MKKERKIIINVKRLRSYGQTFDKKTMKTFLIREITFSSESKNVTCFGTLNMGHFSLSTTFRIDFSQLNVLLNKISRCINIEELYQCLVEEPTSEGTFYSINLEDKGINPIAISELNEKNNLPLRISA